MSTVGATNANGNETGFAAAKTCGRPESSSVCEDGTESGLQHLPPNLAHGILPLTIGMAPKHTREGVSTRPVIGHAQTVPGTRVANIANNARIEKGSRSHAFIEVEQHQASSRVPRRFEKPEMNAVPCAPSFHYTRKGLLSSR